MIKTHPTDSCCAPSPPTSCPCRWPSASLPIASSAPRAPPGFGPVKPSWRAGTRPEGSRTRRCRPGSTPCWPAYCSSRWRRRLSWRPRDPPAGAEGGWTQLSAAAGAGTPPRPQVAPHRRHSPAQPAAGRAGGRANLLTSRPVAAFRAHPQGYELTLLLAGTIEDGDTRYQAGDFIWRDASHAHSPHTPDGCLCYTVQDAPVQFTKGCRGCSTASAIASTEPPQWPKKGPSGSLSRSTAW